MRPNYLVIPLLTLLVAVTGSAITRAEMEWYRTLALPAWTPPPAVIGAVWTVIFVLTALSALVYWNRLPRGPLFINVTVLYAANAVLNVGWSWLFFGLHWIGAALVETVLLEVVLIAQIVVLWRAGQRLAAGLLLPYAGWVVFAGVLNWAVLRLN